MERILIRLPNWPGRELTPLDEAINAERQRIVGDCIAKLPGHLRPAVIGHYYSGLTMREIAGKEKVPIGTVKRRLHDARRKLAVRLEQYYHA